VSDEGSTYDGREQTLVKHRVLERYLQRFAFIIGSWSESITYVDCYSYAKLSAYAEGIEDIEIETRNANFEDCIYHILHFVRADRKTFPFFLIDPTGWSIPLELIRPLLQQNPGEVLIAFMLEFIRRFINHPERGVRQTIDSLYGEPNVQERFSDVHGDDRDDLLLSEYVKRVQGAGGFQFASSSLVLHPEKARRHFNLVYLTRHPRGIEVFKEAEKKAMLDMESARAQAAKRRRELGGQIDLFGAEDLHKNEYFDRLRDRALEANATRMFALLRAEGQVPYDDLWAMSLQSPLIWPTDVSGQLKSWGKEGLIELTGLQPNQRNPKLSESNRVVLLK